MSKIASMIANKRAQQPAPTPAPQVAPKRRGGKPKLDPAEKERRAEARKTALAELTPRGHALRVIDEYSKRTASTQRYLTRFLSDAYGLFEGHLTDLQALRQGLVDLSDDIKPAPLRTRGKSFRAGDLVTVRERWISRYRYSVDCSGPIEVQSVTPDGGYLMVAAIAGLPYAQFGLSVAHVDHAAG